jgi:glucose/mannose-6-phosphate isomerase
VSARLEAAAVAAADPGGMRRHLSAWPQQLAEGRRALAEHPWPGGLAPPGFRLLAAGGLGGSAIGADLVRGLTEDALAVPFMVVRDYAWPRAVGPGTLCVLSSYSGNTEETLALYDEAGRRGAARAALTSGGELARRARADGVPCAPLPPGLPPRAALGYSLVSLLGLTQALGCPGEGEGALDEAQALLVAGGRRLAPEVPEAENPAKLLALSLQDRIVIVYTASRLLSGVGLRWKGQINENAKTPAFHGAVPELNHNETVGWEALRPLHGRFAVICLRDREEHPRVARQLELTRELVAEEGLAALETRSSGRSRLARLLSLVQLGDWVSLYLAVLAGVDPSPIAKIDRLKRALETPA